MQKLLIVGSGDVARRALPLLIPRYRVFALLRNPADKAAPGLQDYDLSLLFDARPESIPLPQRRGIPVLYGGSGMPVPADALRLQGHRSGTDPPMPVPMPPAPVAAPPPTVLINAAAAPP